MNKEVSRVLLVDDYPDALETWRLFLELAGFDVVTASDGQQALDVARDTQPDIIVMDLELPVLSGFDATAELKRDPLTRATPVIAATGHSHFNRLDQTRLELFDVVVVKPCDPSQLVAHINRLLALDDSGGDRGGHVNEYSDAHNG